MTENYTGQKAQTQREPSCWESRRVRVASRRQGGLVQEKTPADCLLPLPSPVSAAQARAPAPGLHKRGFDCNRKPLRRGELGKPPPLGPRLHPPLLAPYPVPAPILPSSFLTPQLWAPSSFTPPFSLLLPPPSETPPHRPSGGTPKLGLSLGVWLLALKCPLFTFLREGFGRKGEFSRNSEPLILQPHPEGGRRGERRGA